MAEAPGNNKESSHSAHAKGMNERMSGMMLVTWPGSLHHFKDNLEAKTRRKKQA